jgi:integrase/recombinase XerD
VGSSPTPLTPNTDSSVNRLINSQKERLIYGGVAQSSISGIDPVVSCQRRELQLAILRDALTAYCICAKAEGRSGKTISWTTEAVGYLANFLGGDGVDLATISAQTLRSFILALQTRPAFSRHRFVKPQSRLLSSDTVASYTRAIKSFFSFLEREELIPFNPMAKVKLPKTQKKVMPCFTEKELSTLMAQPERNKEVGYRDYAIMATLLDTAIRVSELCGLDLDDVDLNEGYLRVMGKGGKERFVPIGYRLTKILLTYKLKYRPQVQSCDRFFVTHDSRPLNKDRVEKIIKRYGTKAGLKVRCSPHTFRATSAVLYLRNDGDTFSLQKKLGHASLTMTRRYSELADSDVRARHLKSSPLDRLSL